MLAGLLAIAATARAAAGPTGWAHQAAGFQSNGAVTVKSLAGGSYAGTQNPTGAVAKANQNAVTQAPTVIIQATSGSTFSYTTDCYIIEFVGHTGAGYTFVGAGKLNGLLFTGMLALANTFGRGSSSFVLGALTGTQGIASGGIATPYMWCGADSACAYSNATTTNTVSSYSGAVGHFVIGVASAPVATAQKCYP